MECIRHFTTQSHYMYKTLFDTVKVYNHANVYKTLSDLLNGQT